MCLSICRSLVNLDILLTIFEELSAAEASHNDIEQLYFACIVKKGFLSELIQVFSGKGIKVLPELTKCIKVMLQQGIEVDRKIMQNFSSYHNSFKTAGMEFVIKRYNIIFTRLQKAFGILFKANVTGEYVKILVNNPIISIPIAIYLKK